MNILDKPEYQDIKDFLAKFKELDDSLYWYAYNINQLFGKLRHMIKQGDIEAVKELDERYINPLLITHMKKFQENGDYKIFLRESGNLYQNIEPPPGGKYWEVEAFQLLSMAVMRIERLDKNFSWFLYENIKIQLEDIKTNENIKLHKSFIDYLVDVALDELQNLESFKNGVNDLRKLGGPEGRSSKLRQTTAIQGFEHTAQGYYLMMRSAVRLFKEQEVNRLMEEVAERIYSSGSTGFGTPSAEWLLCAYDLGYEYLNANFTTGIYISSRLTLDHTELKMVNIYNILSKGRAAVWAFQKSNIEAGLKLENYLNNSKCGFTSTFNTELLTLVQEADIILRQGRASNRLLKLQPDMLKLFKETKVENQDEYAYAKRVLAVVLIRCSYLKRIPNIRTYSLLNEQFLKEKSLENVYGKVKAVKKDTAPEKRKDSLFGKWLLTRLSNETLSDLEYMTASYAHSLLLNE